jgi:soluble lytic murein transglycosylase-like protein
MIIDESMIHEYMNLDAIELDKHISEGNEIRMDEVESLDLYSLYLIDKKLAIQKIKNTKRKDMEKLLDPVIKRMSKKYGVGIGLIKSIIKQESRYNNWAVSPAGAKGLMQIMPETCKRFGVRNPFDPIQNIEGGTKYLRFLMKRFKRNNVLAIAAYNAGEGAVDEYNGIPPYEETQNYVVKVVQNLKNHKKEGEIVGTYWRSNKDQERSNLPSS